MPAIKDLFIALGLKMDDTAFAAADVAIAGLKSGLVAAGAAFGGVITGFAALLKSTADAGTHTARAARQIGISAQQLQGLRFAASDAGVGADELDGAMKTLSRSAYDASIHGGAAGVAFYRLGIQAFTAYGKSRPLQQLLPEIADRFAQLPDGIEKTTWATNIFGEAGAGLIPLLNKGRGALEELTKEAARFGVVMDANTIAAAEGMSKSIRHVNSALEGLRNAIAVPWLRIVSPLLEAFANWVATNRKLIATKVAEWVGFVLRAVAGLYTVVKNATAWFEALWDRAGKMKPVLLALGAVVLGLIAPWAALAAAIALVAEDLYVYSKGGKSLFGYLKDQLEELVDELKDAWNDFSGDPFAYLVKAAKSAFAAIAEEAAKLPDQVAKAVGETKLKQWSDFVLKTLHLDFVPDDKSVVGRAILGSMDDAYAREHPAFSPRAALLPAGAGGLAPQLGPGSGSTINIPITVNAGAGADGKQIGQDIRTAVEPIVRDLLAGERAAAARALNR